ncbi:hypothetical protein BGAL_0597g00070 [Botrytis galanthina]|uniref:Uncharacterized protein n=1 Tax=Botrytis galanthina TaxID=278940 RepID=A0A4S8QMC1_9HELO|nr:hypothetical protein BGAL_0597g00070 [Botrytis galanthina]
MSATCYPVYGLYSLSSTVFGNHEANDSVFPKNKRVLRNAAVGQVEYKRTSRSPPKQFPKAIQLLLTISLHLREDKLQRAKDLREEESEQALSLAKYNFEGICAERDRYKDDLAKMNSEIGNF